MSKQQLPAALPMQFRDAKIDGKPKDGKRLSGEDPGRFSFALTSEEPVRRWFGDEILNHGKSNVRTGRIDAGMMPLLFNHDPNMHLGRVDSFDLKDGVLRVGGQFGPSPLAQEKRADYDAGILNAASGGYRVHKVVRTEDQDNPNAPDRVDVTDWEPFDASLVTVPADTTVGVGRSGEGWDDCFPVEIETRSAREFTGDTKKVDGVHLTKDSFAYTPDDVPSHWEFPLHFPGDDAKTKEHVEKAVQLFSTAKLPESAKAAVWDKIVSAAKAHGVKIGGKDADHPDNQKAPEKRSEAAPSVEVISEKPSTQENRKMPESVNTPSPEALELKRVQDILAVAADKDFGKHVSQDEVRNAMAGKTSADDFKDAVIRKIVAANEVSKVGTVGDGVFAAAGRDGKRYSMVDVLRSLINQKSPGTFRDAKDITFEREMSDELGKRINQTTTGVFMPIGALTRALGTQAIGSGAGQIEISSEAAAVETITRPDVIELLRNRPRTQALGARTLGGLQGIVRLPRQSGAGTWQWLGEGATVTAADLAMDFVSVQPRRGSTQSAVDIELLASTSPDVEGLMRADFNKIRNLAIDLAALTGAAGGPQPQGLMSTTGLTLITPTGTAFTDTGKPLTYLDVISFETVIAAANADVATMGWMFTPEVRGILKGTPKFTNTGGTLIAEPIWKEGPKDPSGLEEGPLGYKAGITNQLPKNGTGDTGNNLHTAIFGDWSQLLLADWGVVEVIYDPYTQAGSGAIVLTMRSLHDVAVRHIAAFAASKTIAVA